MNSHCSSEFFEVLRVAVGLSRQSGTIVNRGTASGCIVQVGGLRVCVAVSANGLTRPSRRSRPRCTRTRQEARCSLLSWRWSCLPQVYERGSDAAAVEESVLDLRWRTGLDLLVRCSRDIVVKARTRHSDGWYVNLAARPSCMRARTTHSAWRSR